MAVHLDRLTAETRQALDGLAVVQFDIVTREQLAAAGVSRHAVAAQLDARRWQPLGATVIALHNGPLSRPQQWAAAVLSADEPAALTARTAMEAYGLTGWETDVIHVVVRRGAKVNVIPGLPVKVHESRRFDADDIHPGRSPASVRVQRAAIDAATWSRKPRTAVGIVAAAVQQRLTTVPLLWEVLETAGQIRHRRLLAAALTDIEGGAQALSEIDFLRFCRRHGLPRPRLQVRVDAGGRRRYLDAEFDRRDGRVVGVEIDGAIHLVVSTYWQDMARLNDLVIGGKRILRLPSAAIYANDPVAVAQLRQALLLPDLSDRRPAMTG